MRTPETKLYEAAKDLIFTASKLWDEVKPIKDTDAMTVTHPIIEEAKQAVTEYEQSQVSPSRNENEQGIIIADEAWRMLTTECKIIMQSLHQSFIESIASDVNHLLSQQTSCLQSEIERLRKEVDELKNDRWVHLFNDLGKFTVDKFPDAGPYEHLKKLIIEANEAIQDISDKEEYADCLLAIFGAAYKAGFSCEELFNAAYDKLRINKNRVWEKLSDGTYQHV